LWDATSGRHLRTISDDVAHAGVTGLSADGGLLVAAGGDGTLTRAWDLSWPLRARQVFDDAANAAHPTRDADPTALIARHALRGRLDWVHLLATDGERSDAPTSVGADTDMPGGIMAPTFAIARASWVKGDTERAARAFAELARRHDAAGAATDYLQICQDAIARERAGEDKEIDLWPSPQVGQP
ncbi:MAG: hypothetical protein ACREIT_06955, partial [Tepidisphaeraceae bacterium]